MKYVNGYGGEETKCRRPITATFVSVLLLATFCGFCENISSDFWGARAHWGVVVLSGSVLPLSRRF